MTSLNARLLISVTFLAAIQGGVMLIGRNYEPSEVVIPARQLRELPLELGDWRGEDHALDPKLFAAIGAHSVVDRKYRNPSGEDVLLHVVISDQYTDSVPHYPEVCFAGGGWEVRSRTDSDLTTKDDTSVHARLLIAAQDANKVAVLFWYQLGEKSFVDRDGFRNARRELWGQDHWPPVIKVMLQTTAVPDAKKAEARLRELGALVLAWTKDLR